METQAIEFEGEISPAYRSKPLSFSIDALAGYSPGSTRFREHAPRILELDVNCDHFNLVTTNLLVASRNANDLTNAFLIDASVHQAISQGYYSILSLPWGEWATFFVALEDPSESGETEDDWERWHQLLDLREERQLTPDEEIEYQEFSRIVVDLDARETSKSNRAARRLMKQHERVLAAIRKLTSTLREATKLR